MKRQLLSLCALGLVFSGFTSYAGAEQTKAVTTMAGTTYAVARLDTADDNDIPEEISITMISADSENSFDYGEYIASFDSLTQEEKDALMKLHEETTPLYDNLMDLYLKLATADTDEKVSLEKEIANIEKTIEEKQQPLQELLEKVSTVTIAIAYEESEGGEMISFTLPEIMQ